MDNQNKSLFKIAIGAGHYLGTPGRRVPTALDKQQTKEWQLNNRVAEYAAEAAKQYEGVEILRVDDSLGVLKIEVADRCKAANAWGADFCLAIHHDAYQGKPWNGGGVTAFSAPKDKTSAAYRDAIYEAVIAAGKLRGNRASPKQEKGYKALTLTNAPAVLVEYGFMDSKADAPVILTEEYAKAVGYATMEAIAQVANLKKNPKLYRVQVGAFAKQEYAQAMLEKLGNAGFTGYIKED
jgi:N-acetylmuramoyl-L-alanine amidase